MKKTFTIFYSSGNKVVVTTSDLTVRHNGGVQNISWLRDGNIFYLNPDGIEAIVEGKQ